MSEDERTWRDELSDLLAQSAAMVEAVADLVVTSEDPHVWIRRGAKTLTAYVAEPGWLHRLSGQQDPYRDPSKPDETHESKCEYRALQITDASSFLLAITVTSNDRLGTKRRREWTFQIDGEQFTLPPPAQAGDPDPTGDPTEFARQLAMLIALARTERS